WAPLGPNISVSIAVGGGYDPPAHYWCFVPHQYVTSPMIRNYYVNESRNVTIIHNTTIINNTTVINNNRPGNRRFGYAGGPDINEAGRYSGGAIRPVTIRDNRAPGDRSGMNNGEYSMYRPRMNDGNRNNEPGNGNRGNMGNNGNGGRSAMAPSRVQTW